ncbi:hypothetical protein MXB_5341 [Myxobolus squamalis]|nr:hypothetical protein MXB_5341 [Myxobolus squamalis]
MELSLTEVTHIHPYLSVLVNYIRPATMNSLSDVTSLNENACTSAIKAEPIKFSRYTIHSLIRVYPSGKRVESNNYNPQAFWNGGSQMAALNFQTAVRLIRYILKPEYQLNDLSYSPIGGNLTSSKNLFSGIFLADSSKNEIYCIIETTGRFINNVVKKIKCAKQTEGYSPTINFNSEKVSFNSRINQEYNYIRFAVMDKNILQAQRIVHDIDT